MYTESYWPAEGEIVRALLADLGAEFHCETVTDPVDGATWMEFVQVGEGNLLPPQGMAVRAVAALAEAMEPKKWRTQSEDGAAIHAGGTLPPDVPRPFFTPACCGFVDITLPVEQVTIRGPRSGEQM